MELLPEIYRNENIDYRNYTTSLMEIALQRGVIDQEDLAKIYLQSYQLLELQVQLYTSKESTSLPEETANRLLLSSLYIIGLKLQTCESIEEQIHMFFSTPIKELYSAGLKLTDTLMKKARFYYEAVKKNALDLPVTSYQTSIFHSFLLFFENYDAKFNALNSIVWFEYVLSKDLNNMSGIQYILEYLKRIYFENTICRHFPLASIKTLLNCYDLNYQDLIFNIFDLVLTNASGCILLGKNPSTLKITKSECHTLEALASTFQSPLQLQEQLSVLFLTEFGITDSFGTDYLTDAIHKFATSFLSPALKHGLNTLFILYEDDQDSSLEEIQFIDSLSMDNKAFTALYEELCACRYTSDKLTLFKNTIHSLKDTIDMLSTDCFYPTEYKIFFETLSTTELLLLIKNIVFEYIPMEKDFIAQAYNYELAKEWYFDLLKVYESKIKNNELR